MFTWIFKHQLPALEQFRCVLRAFQTSKKIVSNISLRPQTNLAERSILDVWLSLECASTGEYITVLKIKIISIWRLSQLIVWS